MAFFTARLAPAALAACILSTCFTASFALAQSPHPVAKPQQFVYLLRVVPHLQDEAKWTAKDKAATSRHFERLKTATEAGQVILAGRTTEPLNKTFGLVVFEAENEAAAKAFMNADPAVVAGVMVATLHPYSVALQRK